MSLSTSEGAQKLYDLLFPEPKPAPATGPVRKHQIIGMASVEELRERARLASERRAYVAEKTAPKHAKNFKGTTRTVICPCGVSFEVPSHWAKDSKKYHSPECRAKYRAGVKWKFTPEMDDQIRCAYRNQVGMTHTAVVKSLAQNFGCPRHRVSKRALNLGLIPVARIKKPQNWTEAEKQIVRQHAGLTLGNIRQYLKKAGFERSENAIKIFILRNQIPHANENYSATRLSKLLGIDGHAVMEWIHKRLLKAERAGTNRTIKEGGDAYTIRPEDVRQFIVANLHMIDFRKLDKFWLVELLTGQEIKL